MVEPMNAFDAEAFAEAVEAALISGVASRIDTILEQAAFGSQAVDASRLWLIVARTCLKMGRTKQARHWLERLAADAAPQNVLPAMATAVACAQPQLAVALFRRLPTAAVCEPTDYLGLAHETLALAERLRLPRSRNNAWALHLELLMAASELLEIALPGLCNERQQAKAWCCLAKVRRLQECVPEVVERALKEAMRHGSIGTSS